ncbi:hypothetical protein AALO_G00270970 [Alosa alosa]|uniref:Uncharacterized protein n=1 Tax=Alosa alosa TaxID=278164 RepID=A0AAV6FN64_9TELE|nr:hypothetical protein AALO_G00270970 [Alosa alosa]
MLVSVLFNERSTIALVLQQAVVNPSDNPCKCHYPFIARNYRQISSISNTAWGRSMEMYMDLCRASSIPLWLAPLLRVAGRLKTDRARRRSAYRFIQRQLYHHRVGCTDDNCNPTYIYPAELKELIRAVFPAEVCNYPDPCNEKV